MNLIIMTEERSMQELLEKILPPILPEDVYLKVIPHSGKSDLQASIPRKLKAWNVPETRFIIVHDQDSADCIKLKKNLQHVCDQYRDGVLIRIACVELESWYFGDMAAVAEAYGKPDLIPLSNKSKYRIPDKIQNPKDELRKILPEHQQIGGARRIGKHMNIGRNTSESFQMFISGVKKITGSVT